MTQSILSPIQRSLRISQNIRIIILEDPVQGRGSKQYLVSSVLTSPGCSHLQPISAAAQWAVTRECDIDACLMRGLWLVTDLDTGLWLAECEQVTLWRGMGILFIYKSIRPLITALARDSKGISELTLIQLILPYKISCIRASLDFRHQ